MTGAPPLTTYLVKQVESAIRARLDTVLRRHSVTTVQYTALTVLQHRGDLSSAQLARRSFVRPQTMHEIVVGLERQGLIERQPSADRRHVLLARLTPAGLNRLADCRADVDLIEREMIQGLTGTEVATLRTLLEHCHQALATGTAALSETGTAALSETG
jgi:DNA-binding MarR family transcriptional regulator